MVKFKTFEGKTPEMLVTQLNEALIDCRVDVYHVEYMPTPGKWVAIAMLQERKRS